MLPRLLDSRLDLVLLAKLTLVATSGVVRDGDSVRDTALPLGNQILTFKPLDLSYKLPPVTHTIGPEQPSRSQKLVDVPSSVFPHSTTCYTSDRPCDLPRQPLPQSPFSTAILVY